MLTTTERTGIQTTSPSIYIREGVVAQLPPATGSGWNQKVRKMRRDATLSFLRKVLSAPLLTSDWTVVSDDQEFQDAVEMVSDSTLPHKSGFLRNTIRGLLDFGWQPFEIVKDQDEDGMMRVERLKPLLQDLSLILTDTHGQLVGVRNTAFGDIAQDPEVDLFKADALVISYDVEGTNWYGEPLMRPCERPYDEWMECDDAARRFDLKCAGAHWVVYYPPGTSNVGGVERDNYLIAKDILAAVQANGMITVPMVIQRQLEDLGELNKGNMGWQIELISATWSEAQFIERLRYLDALKSRGMGIPERAILEGQFGTKAEAEAHADFAIDNIEMLHSDILQVFNKQLVNMLLLVNKGEEYQDKVRVTAAPLSDAKKAFLKQLYMQRLGTEAGQAEEFDTVDWNAVRDEFKIPVRQGIIPEEQQRPVGLPAPGMQPQVDPNDPTQQRRFIGAPATPV